MVKRFLLWIVPLFFLFSICAWEDSFDDYFDDDHYDEDDYDEDSPARIIDDLVYLLEKNIDLTLVPEQFIYPFGADHKPMLSSNLAQTVSDNRPGGFVQTRTMDTQQQGPARRPTPTGPSSMRTIGSVQSSSPTPAPVVVQSVAVDPKSGKKEEVIVLPPFEIDGVFGSEYEQYIIVGTRYYTLEQTLRGTRELRRVRLVGIDSDHAYFRYRDMTFPKKIKALEKVFQ